jgi:hypothetical protein
VTRKAAAVDPPEVSYFRAIEEDFVSRRGGVLLLSTADWHLIWKWHHARIPLRVVLRGIADAFESHAHSWNRKQTVRGLRYCADEVERARARWRRALSLDHAESIGEETRLASLAQAWEDAALPAGLWPARDAVVAAFGTGAPPGSDLQTWLGERERDIAARLAQEAGVARVEAFRREARADLERYKERMPGRTFDKIVEEGVTRRLFEAFGVPRLTFLA